jgi:hypothetical protein
MILAEGYLDSLLVLAVSPLFTEVPRIEILGSSGTNFVSWGTYFFLGQEYGASVT